MAFDGVKRLVEAVQRNRIVAYVLTIQKRFGEDGGGSLAASLTYYSFLSIFPLMLVAVSVMGFVLAGDEPAQIRLANKLAGSIPGLGQTLADNIDSVVEARGVAGVVGVLGAMWSGTGLARAASFALGRVSRKPEQGGFLQTQIWAVSSTIGLGALALVATGVGAVLPAAVSFSDGVGALLGVLGIVVGFVLDLALFTTCYRVLNRSLPRPITHVWRGALIPAIGWTALKPWGEWYADRAQGSAAVFGTFAAVVGILVILYLVSRLFVYGAEVNNVLREKREGKTSAGEKRAAA